MGDAALRDSTREPTWLRCLLRVDQETIVHGLITNVSRSGAELCSNCQLEIGQKIEVAMLNYGSRSHAAVIRVNGNRFGIQWQTAIEVVHALEAAEA